MNLFELFVKIGVDDQASGKLSKLSIGLGKGLATAAKIGTAAVGAAATGITALTTAAVKNYAEYEQLVGGVDTLFKSSSTKVQKYAADAYKTAGMSANEYMSTVTSFSASLLQSLGDDTEAAAEYANQALIDMSDNANKMGTSMEMIQNAYQGFAKQNYTMLDNLKLGYGGTKTEMERLIADANRVKEANGEMANLSIDSFADVTEAIHIVQTEMGITGTTAEEASETISGSVTSMKAAWANLVTGIGDSNANISVLLDEFLVSVETVGVNLLPVIGRIVSGIFQTLESRGPEMIAEGVLLIGKLAVGFIEAIPDLVSKIPELIQSVVDAFTERAADFEGIGARIVEGLWNGIKSLTGWLGEKVNGFLDGLFAGAQENEEIHSPSRKWARFGANMAAGLAVGWGEEFPNVIEKINNGLDFGTKEIGFESSSIGGASAGVVNGIGSSITGRESERSITVNLMMPDGTQFASYILGPLAAYAKANGTPLLSPQ